MVTNRATYVMLLHVLSMMSKIPRTVVNPTFVSQPTYFKVVDLERLPTHVHGNGS
jgi:hypothetical protein